MKKTIVIGASPKPERYSNQAVVKLNEKGNEVIALGIRADRIGEIAIRNDRPEIESVDTITLYINPQAQAEWYSYIINTHPKRIIFNPGTENNELAELANANGIEPVEACTLVLLATNQY